MGFLTAIIMIVSVVVLLFAIPLWMIGDGELRDSNDDTEDFIKNKNKL